MSASVQNIYVQFFWRAGEKGSIVESASLVVCSRHAILIEKRFYRGENCRIVESASLPVCSIRNICHEILSEKIVESAPTTFAMRKVVLPEIRM